MTALRAGLYARVSTAEQQTLPMQMAALRECAERRNWIVTYAIEEVGNGARKRPRQQELIKLATQRQLDVIIVWRLDRWGRSLVDLMESLQRPNQSWRGLRIDNRGPRFNHTDRASHDRHAGSICPV